jgi:hypothetical protein
MSNRVVLLVGLFGVFFSCARTHDNGASTSANYNSVAVFLEKAERQTETEEQRLEVHRALSDMLTKTPVELRQTRYADYTGKANQWPVTQLLQRYFVPSPPAALDEARFYRDVQAPTARAAVQHQIDELSRASR